jgi:uncharacterized lipoprotein YehR (DUF1307 family)
VEKNFSKLLEKRRNESYKFMYNMLEALTKEDFNKVYERFKATYTNDVGVLKYVEKEWARNGSLRGLIWPR